ncbi:hypothetical protein [Burkholderia gladioli]|uniref:hypothetical protein n=1 Tax=Burkholderia gladioli TaxID=28095 RepID=UPI001FC85C54|nr:hypothetical protein [Burkholderia gladioli]
MDYQIQKRLRELTSPPKPAAKAVAGALFDSAAEAASEAGSPSSDYAAADIRMKAAGIVQEFASTSSDDLGDGESLVDRLLALVLGAVDIDKDGDVSDDEAAVADMILDAAWDYMTDKGVSDDDAAALINDGDEEAAVRVRDLLADSFSDDDAALDDLDEFAFDTDAEQPIFDDAGAMILDAVYRRKVVVRQGRKMKVNKRISGHVRLSAKQKLAVRKMQRKSHTAGAMMRRLKSLRIRKRAGL